MVHFGQQRQRWIDHARAWYINPAGAVLYLADQFVTMARRIGDQCQQDQPQLVAAEHATPPAPRPAASADVPFDRERSPLAASAWAELPAHAARVMMMMVMSSKHINLPNSSRDASKIYLNVTFARGRRK